MRKLCVFVSLFIMLFPLSGYAQTDDVLNLQTKDRKSDYFSDEGFGEVYTEEDVSLMRYKKTMDSWKNRQSHLWENLEEDSFVINASAYTASLDECGKTDGITASGVRVQELRTLACPPRYPFGVKIEIETMGTYVCEDRGGAIQGNHFDIYMETKSEAFAFGRKNLTARVVME